MKQYSSLLLSRDILGLLELMLEDIDKDELMKEVMEERSKYPDWTSEMLAEAEINSLAKTMSSIAVTGGLASIVPGAALLATSGEIISLFIFQSRMVVKIACYFDKDLNSKDRITDILIGIAGTGAGSGGAKLGAMTSKVAIQKICQTVASKMGQATGKAIPGVGAVAGVIGGTIGAFTNYCAVKSVGEITIRRYGGKTQNLVKLDSAVMDVAIAMAWADGQLSTDELDAFNSALEVSCLSEDLKAKKRLLLKTGFSPQDLKIDVQKADKAALVRAAATMAVADKQLDVKEKELLYTIGKKCSIKPTQVDEIIVETLEEMASIKELHDV